MLVLVKSLFVKYMDWTLALALAASLLSVLIQCMRAVLSLLFDIEFGRARCLPVVVGGFAGVNVGIFTGDL